MIPCPDCHNLHLHAVHCPNLEPLPRYATAPTTTADTVCPICHEAGLGCVQFGCWTDAPKETVFLIEPRTILEMDQALCDEDLEAAR